MRAKLVSGFLHEVHVSTVESPMALFSARTWVGISSYSFICFSAPNTTVGGNDSHLLFVIFKTSSMVFLKVMEINMPIKDAYLCKAVFFVFILNPQNTLVI